MGNGLWIKSIVAVLCFCSVAAGQAAQVIYVDGAAVGADDGSSWSNAYRSLQDALGAAGPPVVIRVAQGVYKPDQGAAVTGGDWDAAFGLLDGVTLEGGYAGVTGVDPDARDVDAYPSVLSGDLNGDGTGPGDSNRLVVANGTDATAVIDGFTITAALGSGMLVESGSPTIRNCAFEGNHLHGLYARESRGLTLTDCRFVANRHNGIYAWDCHFILTNCVFEGNGSSWLYAGIKCPEHLAQSNDNRPSHLQLTNCVLRENNGNGLDIVGTLDLQGCSFTGNTKEAICCRGSLTARKCNFKANGRSMAGAIRCSTDIMRPYAIFDCTLVDCEFLDNLGADAGAVMVSGDRLTATRCAFVGNSTLANSMPRRGIPAAGAIASNATVTQMTDCLFAGNWYMGEPEPYLCHGAGAVGAEGVKVRVSNCTFVGNRGEPSAINLGSGAEVTQCIVWDEASAIAVEPEGAVTYSNVQGGFAGAGNIDVDPCFVDPGYWNANDTPDDLTDDIWVAGDYHLKSQAGHWDAESEGWVLDDVTSPCIDAGDPNAPIDAEPFPNGGYANLGAYGGTAEASRSYFGGPVCATQIAGDINGDCKVDDLDMDLLMSHWLMEDIGRINAPPNVTVMSPADGAEFSSPTPVVLRADAFDTDGTVLWVEYVLMARSSSGGTYVYSGVSNDPTDNWAWQLNWSWINYEGVYTVWARAVDNEGAKTISPTITVTLHP